MNSPDGSPSDDPMAVPVRSEPGETIPAARRLDRPPGDRYRTRTPEQVLERPNTARALLLGTAGGVGTVTVIAVFNAILSITAGLMAIAVLGGWLIGLGVRQGAWSGRPHRPSRLPGGLAAGLGMATWLGGLLASWLLSMAILPGSSRSFPDRLAATPFLDWLAPQFAALDIVTLVVLVGVAWAASRSRSVERTGDADRGSGRSAA